ncbi:MAG TPA: NAD(P)-dependent oxidoreductase, partial [Polyangiaceae bacterium]
MTTLPREDLDSIVSGLGEKWSRLRGADVLVTGGTGFFGVWLVSALLHANTSLGLGLRVHVMARRPEQFLDRAPEYQHESQALGALRLIRADIRNIHLPNDTRLTHVVHAATAASAALNDSDPIEMASVAAEGTRQVLELARQHGVERMLLTSSGAVYGRNAPSVTHVSEDQMGVVDPLLLRNAYTEGKRLAELYCAAYAEKRGLAVTIARCFAFVGPYLPLDAHFAIGNFMRDALQGKPIIVQSDGSSRRSYLYATDLVLWLLTLLLDGVSGRAYNVGSEHDVSVGELARLIGEQCGTPVEVRGKPDPTRPIDAYVPCTRRIREELGVEGIVNL